MKQKEKLYLIGARELEDLLMCNRGSLEDYIEVPEGAVGFFIIDGDGLRSVRTWDDQGKLSQLRTIV